MTKTEVVQRAAEARGVDVIDVPLAEVDQDNMKGTITMLPIDDPSNRLGDIVLEHQYGEVRHYTPDGVWHSYYAWPSSDRRGFKFKTLDDAAKHLGIRKPCGCNDYDGKERLGKLMERHPGGEIWKSVRYGDGNNDLVDYYVWLNSGETLLSLTLREAREALGVEIQPNSPMRLPKSAYPQNQKGYDPHRAK